MPWLWGDNETGEQMKEMYIVKFRKGQENYWETKDKLTESTLDLVIKQLKDLFKMTNTERMEVVLVRVSPEEDIE